MQQLIMDPQEYITTVEATAVDRALLSTHEKFLARITISSLRLLAKIAADSGVAIEDLTPELIIAWFEADSKRQLATGDNALRW
jgi:hypothetical protein